MTMDSLQKHEVMFEKVRPRLVRWLRHKPWAAENAEDLASDAYLACLELSAAGKKPRNYYHLAKETARKQKLLPFRIFPKNASDTSYLSKTRREIEQQIDFVDLSAFTAPPASQSRLAESIEFINKNCCSELKKAVELILVGNTASQAAELVGWRPDQLSRAFSEIGKAMTGRSRKHGKNPKTRNQQPDLFSFGGLP
jgi:DNA-directed RNA polymerase specialized sigma24 family protein